MNSKFLYIIVVFALVFTSCLGTQSNGLSDDPKITSFSVANKDTTVDLSKVKFNITSINDTHGVITTVTDSLPYGASLNALIVSVGGASLSSVKIFESSNGEKQKEFDARDERPDTVNFTDTVYIETVAANKKAKFSYKIKLHVHQQDPDLYIWRGVVTNAIPQNITQEKVLLIDKTMMWYVKNGSAISLYTSDNGKAWQHQTISGLPAGIDIRYMVAANDSLYLANGTTLYRSQNGMVWQQVTTSQSVDNTLFAVAGSLFAIDKTTLKLYKYASNNWQEVAVSTPSGLLPDNFPIEGAGIWTDVSANGISRVYLAGGVDKDGNLLNTIWASENGVYWVNLGNNSTIFTARRDVTIFQYDNKLMLIGGRDNAGVVATSYQIYSPDYGITWAIPPANMAIGSLFVPRYNANAVVRTDIQYVYLVGGQAANGAFINDVWSGAKNGLLWELEQK